MSAAIDVLFWIGLLSTALKAGDLFLRENQKQLLEDRIETFTLWLEYAAPLEWFGKLKSVRAQFILLCIGIIEFVVILVSDRMLSAPPPPWAAAADAAMSAQDTFDNVSVIVASLVTLPFVLRSGGPAVMRWLLGRGGTLSFGRRWMALTFGGMASLLAYVFLCVAVAGLFGPLTGFDDHGVLVAGASRAEWVFSAGMLLVWPLFVYFFVVTQAGGLVLWLSVLLWVCHGLVIVARGVAWRVVEHANGPYAALLVILTTILGVASFLLKH